MLMSVFKKYDENAASDSFWLKMLIFVNICATEIDF